MDWSAPVATRSRWPAREIKSLWPVPAAKTSSPFMNLLAHHLSFLQIICNCTPGGAGARLENTYEWRKPLTKRPRGGRCRAQLVWIPRSAFLTRLAVAEGRLAKLVVLGEAIGLHAPGVGTIAAPGRQFLHRDRERAAG